MTKSARRLVAAACLLAVSAAGLLAGVQTRKPLTFDDFIRIRRVSDPRISPDGTRIAFVITSMSLDTNRGDSDIWVVSMKGGEPGLLVGSPQADHTPRWSPDGRTLAFVSGRSGTPQIWTIEPAGGGVKQLTTIPTGASNIVWSPAGTHLAFASSVLPESRERGNVRKGAEDRADSPVKARLYDRLLYRHWNTWWDGTRSHVFVVPAAGGDPVDVTPGDYDTPPIALGGAQDFVFSPDGKEICFVRNVDPRPASSTDNDLFVVSARGGRIVEITPENRANDHSPRYSPDGRYIAYLAMDRPGFEADKLSVMLYDRKARSRRNLTADLDASAGELLWAPDGSVLYFDAPEAGRTALYRIEIPGGAIEKVLGGRTFGGLSISPDGGTMVMLSQAIDRPNDLWALDLGSKEMRRLTDVNAGLLAGLDMNPAEEFRFAGAAGDEIHGFLLKPPAFSAAKKYPLVMLIHGGPQGSFGDDFHFRWNAQMFAAPGYVVAMINFHGSTGYGQAFTDSISGDWGGKPYEDIMKGLDHVIATSPFVDGDRVGAAGASYGGYMINWIEGQTDRFNCLVSHDGVFDLRSMYGATEELWFPEWEFRGTPWTNPEQYAKWSPSMFVQNFKTPCLVIHGANDYRVPLEQGLQLFTSLQKMDVPSQLLYFPDEDHFVQKPLNAELWWDTVLGWLGRWLK